MKWYKDNMEFFRYVPNGKFVVIVFNHSENLAVVRLFGHMPLWCFGEATALLVLCCVCRCSGRRFCATLSCFFLRLNAIRNSTKRVSEDNDAAEELSPDKRQHLNASDEELLAAR